VIFFFLIRYFPHLHFQCYPKSPLYPARFPYLPTPPLWPWRSPILGHIKFASPMGLSFHWWPTRPSFDTYAARDKSSGVLVSSYCCSTYRVAVPFSSLGTFSSFSIGGPVIHPIADCEHPLLCLLDPGILQQLSVPGSVFPDSNKTERKCWGGKKLVSVLNSYRLSLSWHYSTNNTVYVLHCIQ
jgi:hypothetical protein